MIVKISKDLENIIPKFLEKRKFEIEGMKNMVYEGNLEEAENIAHGLKGVFGSYGFDEIYKLCNEIDEDLKKNNSNEALEKILYLIQLFKEIKIEFVDEEV